MPSILQIAPLPIGGEGLTGNKNLSAVRPTQLLQALNVSYEKGTLSKEGGSVKYNTSIALQSSDGEVNTSSTSMVKVKEITLATTIAEIATVKFDMKGTGFPIGGSISGRVYKNGSPIGILNFVNNYSTYVTYSEDFTGFTSGDLIQIYASTEPGGTVYIENFRIYSDAMSGNPKILGGWDWFPDEASQRMIVYTDDGDLLKDSGDGTFPVTLKSGLGTSVVPVFVEGGKEAAAGNKKLFVFNGNNVVQVLIADGATTSDLDTPPADWSGGNQPSFGEAHEGRIFAGGNVNDPHRIYYSTATDHEDYTGSGSGSLSVFPGEGSFLVGAISFKGILIVWKFPRGIYVIDTSDSTMANWRVRRLNKAIGMSSPLAMVQIDDDVLFADSGANFQLLSAVTAFGDVVSRNLSELSGMGEYIRENINLSRLNKIQSIYYPDKREAHFAIAGIGASANSRRLVIDFNNLQLPRFRFSDKDTCESMWLRRDSDNIQRPMSGDDVGLVWNLDQTVKAKGGSGYNSIIQLPHTDLSYLDPTLGAKRKNGHFLELVVEPTGNWNLTADIIWDGAIRETVQFNMGLTGAGLGDFTFDTNVLVGDQVINKKRRITGSGRRFSVIFRNSGAGQDFSLANAYLHFSIADERL